MQMKQKIILPVTDEEIAGIRKRPEKTLDFPTFSKQKVGIIIYSCLLIFPIVMYVLGILLQISEWSFYLLLFLPISYSYNLLNLFAVVDDGMISGGRFIAWKSIKSFAFVRIDINHKFYGHSKEANDGYELKVKTKGYFISSAIITSDEMKGKLNRILNERIKVNDSFQKSDVNICSEQNKD